MIMIESILNSISEYYEWEWESTKYFYSGFLSPGFLQLYFWIFIAVFARIKSDSLKKDL